MKSFYLNELKITEQKYLRIVILERIKSLKHCLFFLSVQLKFVAKSSIIAFLNIFRIMICALFPPTM